MRLEEDFKARGKPVQKRDARTPSQEFHVALLALPSPIGVSSR